MSFSAEWLALRAPADRRARSGALAARAADLVARATDGPVRIADVGSGTGATVRAFAPRLARAQHWTLIDADAALLAEATRLTADDARATVTIETLVADLAANPAPWTVRPNLVTASALFDLTSIEWIERFADALTRQALALYASLTFDGSLLLSPAHPLDAAMIGAFHTHQHGDKGFGPAAGPNAGRALAEAFARRGYRVDVASTPWLLEGERDAACIAAMLDGWAGAANEVLDDSAAIAQWRDFHRNTEEVYVGHVDILATPPTNPNAA